MSWDSSSKELKTNKTNPTLFVYIFSPYSLLFFNMMTFLILVREECSVTNSFSCGSVGTVGCMHARANTVTLGSVKKTHDLSFTIPSGHRSMCAGQHLCVLKGKVTERKLDWITEVRIQLSRHFQDYYLASLFHLSQHNIANFLDFISI